MRTLWLLLLWASTGCSEQGFRGESNGLAAVISGDFDDVTGPLDRMVVAYDLYDGVLGAAAWDPDYDPEAKALKAEGLLEEGAVLNPYTSLFVASGARGFGEIEYNGVDPDDHFAANEAVMTNLVNFTANGKTIFATDWTYDLVERGWPGRVDFVGDDAVLDAAQTGVIGRVEARITDRVLERALDTDTVSLQFNYSNWAPMVDVASDVRVWMRGDVRYRIIGELEDRILEDVPLLVSFVGAERSGLVVYSTFHLDAQHEQVADEIVAVVAGIEPS